jgi:hypothetical protein
MRIIVAAVQRHAHLFVSPRALVRRQLAAAGLARCVALLEGMCLVCEGGRPEIMGILVRAMFETWLVANYILLKGKDAEDELVLIELGNEFARSVTAMARGTGRRIDETKAHVDRFKASVADHPDNVPGDPAEAGVPGDRLKFEQLASAVKALIIAREGSSVDAVAIYNAVYRGESTYSAHPGLGTLHAYMNYDPTEENDTLTLRPRPPFPNQAGVGSLLTIDLAFRLFRAFDIVEDGSLAAAYEELAKARREKPLREDTEAQIDVVPPEPDKS